MLKYTSQSNIVNCLCNTDKLWGIGKWQQWNSTDEPIENPVDILNDLYYHFLNVNYGYTRNTRMLDSNININKKEDFLFKKKLQSLSVSSSLSFLRVKVIYRKNNMLSNLKILLLIIKKLTSQHTGRPYICLVSIRKCPKIT